MRKIHHEDGKTTKKCQKFPRRRDKEQARNAEDICLSHFPECSAISAPISQCFSSLFPFVVFLSSW